MKSERLGANKVIGKSSHFPSFIAVEIFLRPFYEVGKVQSVCESMMARGSRRRRQVLTLPSLKNASYFCLLFNA